MAVRDVGCMIIKRISERRTAYVGLYMKMDTDLLRINDTRSTQPLYKDAMTGGGDIGEQGERSIGQHL